EGLDGKEKMSKSLNNAVGIEEPPGDMFGKLMSISDDLMWRYFELLSSPPLAEINAKKNAVAQGALHPKDVKGELARELVARFHGSDAATHAAAQFEQRFVKKEVDPASVTQVDITLKDTDRMLVSRVVAEAKLSASSTEARKLIVQGGVRLNGEKV